METNRRRFVQAASAFTIVPRHVVGGTATQPAPSDRIQIAMIGCGTEAMRELSGFLANPGLRFTAVCDPCQYAVGYRDWSPTGILQGIRKLLNQPMWGAGFESVIPAGRDVARQVIEAYYGGNAAVNSYADFRELLERERDLQAVWVMTPDHLHGVISLAAMAKKKHVMMHKPVANRLMEARAVIDGAKASGVATHFLAWNSGNGIARVKEWIDGGAIGRLREIHNWTNRPVWPQYVTQPEDKPPVPRGFHWDLWLGPEQERPYHPNYTHMVFRGWYDFGAGTMADMGHYSLWQVFRTLQLTSPAVIEPLRSHHCRFDGDTAARIANDFSFPSASAVRFRFPQAAQHPALDLYWYDGGMKPFPPEEAGPEVEELAAEGMMFRGERGVILAGFRVESPKLYVPGKKPEEASTPREREPVAEMFVKACRGEAASPGAFDHAWPISETVNLWAVALRTGRRLKYDAASMRITNDAKADGYLRRNYRSGWELPRVQGS